MLRRQKHGLSQSTTPFACTSFKGWNPFRGHPGNGASYGASDWPPSFPCVAPIPLSSAANSVSSEKNSASSLWHTTHRLRGALTELCLRNSVRVLKTHSVRCLKPYSPKPSSARLRNTVGDSFLTTAGADASRAQQG